MEIADKIRRSREAGYSDEEIAQHAASVDPDFASKYEKSTSAGYSPSDILNHISPKQQEQPQEPGLLEKAGNVIHKGARGLMQLGLGLGEGTVPGMAYDVVSAGSNYLNKTLEDEGMPETNAQRKELPSIQELYKKGGEALGIDTEPQNNFEKAARLTGNIRQVAKNLGFEAVKQGSIAWKAIKEIVSAAPLATTAVAAKEQLGIPEVATLMVGGFGIPAAVQGTKVAARETANAINHYGMFNVRNLSVNPTKFWDSFKAEWGNARREALNNLKSGAFTPEQYQKIKPFLDTAEKYNIPVNLGALTDSKALKDVERIARKRGLEGEQLNAFIQKSAEQWGNSAIELSNRISKTNKYSQQGEVADALLSDVTRKKQETLNKEYTDLYGKATDEFANTRNLTAEELAPIEDALNGVLKKTTGSLTPTTAEEATTGLANEFKHRLNVSPEQAGRGELQGVGLPTGKGKVSKAKGESKELIQDAVDTFRKSEKKAKAAQAKVDKLKRKSSKEKAAAKAQEPIQQAEEDLKAAQEEVKAARERVQKAEKSQQQTVIKSQEDFDKLFPEKQDNITWDKETGQIKFKRNVNAASLVKTIQSLNKTIDWMHPETRNLMKGVLDQTKSTLGAVYGKSNPKAYQAYKDANAKFKESIEIFGQDAPFKKWGIKSDSTPEELLKSVNTLSRFKQFEKTFGGTPQGKELIDELKRLKVQEKLLPVFENWKPGKVNTGLSKLFRDHEFQYMLPKEVRSDLKALQDLDKRIQTTSSDFYSMAQVTPDQKTLLDYVLKFTNPKAAAASLGVKLASDRMLKAYSNVLFDPNITKEMRRIGEATMKAVNNPKTSPTVIKRLLADAELLWSNILGTEAVVAANFAGNRIDQED